MNRMGPTVFASLATMVIAAVAATSGARAHDHDGHESAVGFGQPGDPAKVSRSIVIDMTDNMRYAPARISVRRGETIRFVVRNSGRLEHELVLGDGKELRAHAAMMRQHPTMMHAEPNAVVVDPGKTAQLVWRFSAAGTVDFACLQPGHFEAGMRGQIAVK